MSAVAVPGAPAVAAPRRRWWRPPRTLKVTRTGRTYLVVTVGVGLSALNTGNNLLYLVLGLLLSLIVASGVLSERVLRDLTVRRLGAESPFAGEPFAFRWALARRRGHGFALTVAEAGGALAGEGRLAYQRAGDEVVVRADVTAPRRGPLALAGVEVTTTYPLGLFAKTRTFDLPGTLVVFPARGLACRDPGDAEAGPVGDAGNPRRTDGTGDLLGLAELQPGEDARRVHWLKSASAGKLLRVLREREERHAWTLSVAPGLAGDALERACVETAAQAHRLVAQGHEVGLESEAGRLRPAAGAAQERRILHTLAWLGFGSPGAGAPGGGA